MKKSDDFMKLSKPFLFGICILGMLGSLSGCKEEKQFQTDFPLEQAVVDASLESVGLPGSVSEAETISQAEGHVQYTVRDTAGASEATEDGELIASISCAEQDGGRMLYTIFNKREASGEMKWEDWKQQITLAATLYGGFENEEEVYQAFQEQEGPEGQPQLQWDADLPGGYCTVSYRTRSRTIYDENEFAIETNSATLFVNIYETSELYQKIQENRTTQKAK